MILAGGMSRRYGTDKALARLEGETFLERVEAALQPYVDGVRVLARPDHAPRYEEVLPEAEVVPDPEPFEGPVAALRDGLPEARRIVVASVDAPGLEPRHVDRLLQATTPHRLAVGEAGGDLLPTLGAGPRIAWRRGLDGATRLRDVARHAKRVPLSGTRLNVNRPLEA